jgi:hypothetical protein
MIFRRRIFRRSAIFKELAMRLRILAAATFGAALSLSQLAQAETFQRPPETYWNPPWVGVFPYQRDIFWNFNQNPVGGPSSAGTPGAEYEGTLDAALKKSDSVSLTGAFQWFSAGISPNGFAGVGIDNRNGTDAVTGTFVVSLDNVIDILPFKHIWIESTGFTNVTVGGSLEVSAAGSDPTGRIDVPAVSLPSGLVLQDFGFTLQPNPEHETISLTLIVPAGGYDVINTWQVATQSVPEPATWAMMLAGFGALGLAGYRRSRAAAA